MPACSLQLHNPVLITAAHTQPLHPYTPQRTARAHRPQPDQLPPYTLFGEYPLLHTCALAFTSCGSGALVFFSRGYNPPQYRPQTLFGDTAEILLHHLPQTCKRTNKVRSSSVDGLQMALPEDNPTKHVGGKAGPYNLFTKVNRPTLPTHLRNAEREKLLGLMWQALSTEQRATFKSALSHLQAAPDLEVLDPPAKRRAAAGGVVECVK